MFGVPLPDWAKAANARATKNSKRDTRGFELTKLTICCPLFYTTSMVPQKGCEAYLVDG